MLLYRHLSPRIGNPASLKIMKMCTISTLLQLRAAGTILVMDIIGAFMKKRRKRKKFLRRFQVFLYCQDFYLIKARKLQLQEESDDVRTKARQDVDLLLGKGTKKKNKSEARSKSGGRSTPDAAPGLSAMEKKALPGIRGKVKLCWFVTQT